MKLKSVVFVACTIFLMDTHFVFSCTPIFNSYNITNLEKEAGFFLNRSLGDHFLVTGKLSSFSNQNFQITEPFKSQEWVLRVPDRISNLLSDRKQEKEILAWARKEEISLLTTQAFDLDRGYLLTRFLEGRSYSAEDFQNPTNVQKALDLLHHLHDSKTAPIFSTFNLLNRFIVTLAVAEQDGFCLPEEVHQIASKLKVILSNVSISHFCLVPCHNDPSPENFFCQGELLYLHDWELAGRNDPMWDLSHFSVLTGVEPQELLRFYPTLDPLALEKIVFFKPFVFFNTLVWASLEKNRHLSMLEPQTVQMLYDIFLKKTREFIESDSFQRAAKKLTQGI